MYLLSPRSFYYTHAASHLSTLNLLSVQWWEDWRIAFLTTAKHISLLWMTLTRGPSFLGSLAVATLASVSPGQWWWTKGQDPREGFNSLFRVDCYQGCWLCAHKHTMTHDLHVGSHGEWFHSGAFFHSHPESGQETPSLVAWLHLAIQVMPCTVHVLSTEGK